MTLLEPDGKLNDTVSRWIGPLIALLVALGSLSGVYAKFSAELAVEDERLKILEAYEPTSAKDHDLLIGIDTRLGRIEGAITRLEK